MDMDKRWRRLLAVTMVLAAFAAGCGGDDGASSEEGSGDCGGGDTITVPTDCGTIQEAVDSAEEGTLILVEPGVYEEAVDVSTDDLTIRGLDRNEVILEGNFELENGIRIVEADGVVVENMTAQNYTRNGFFWTGSDGYRGSYLTAVRNGDYGVYAFGSVNGVFEHSYASGSPDAGFYIGQCFPCNALIDDVVSEWNGLGYSGTNSGGDLTIVNSVFRNNRAGVVPNSGTYEGCYPQRETTIVGNYVHDNGNEETDSIASALLAQGTGITVTGGIGNIVERNRVEDNPLAGIAVVPLPEDDPIAPIPDEADWTTGCVEDAVAAPEDVIAELDNPLLWESYDNRVAENVVSGSDEWNMVLLTLSGEAQGNCFTDNEVADGVTAPPDIDTAISCDGADQTYAPETARFLEIVSIEHPEPPDFQTVDLPDPGPQENMPDAADTPAEPAGAPRTVDVTAVTVPAAG